MRRKAAMFSFREPRTYGKAMLVLVFVFGTAAGFGAGHWLRGALDARAAEHAARVARAQLAAAVCVEDFMARSDAHDELAKLVALQWDKRAERIAAEGWATMPDREKPEKAAARLCAVRLGEAYTSVRKNLPVVPVTR